MPETITRYFTFGYDHVHAVNGFTYDKDVVVKITAPDPRAVMLETFGREWSHEYGEDHIRESLKKYYPRGVKELAWMAEPTAPVPRLFWPDIGVPSRLGSGIMGASNKRPGDAPTSRGMARRSDLHAG